MIFVALNEYSTLVDDPCMDTMPNINIVSNIFMFDWVQVKGEVLTTIQTSLK